MREPLLSYMMPLYAPHHHHVTLKRTLQLISHTDGIPGLLVTYCVCRDGLGHRSTGVVPDSDQTRWSKVKSGLITLTWVNDLDRRL